MISSSSLLSATNPYEGAIQQIMGLEGQKKLQLQSMQRQERSKKSALNDVSSKLSTLNTTLDKFLNSTSEQFNPLKSTSSNPDAIEVVSTDTTVPEGSHNIKVTQLAKNDTVLTDLINGANSDMNTTGSGSFDLTIGSGSAINISINTTGLTNQEVLGAVATQINQQAGDQVQASVFNVDGTNYQLSLKSKETGQANQITLSNLQGDLQSLNTSHLYTADQLNAKFTMDGISFQRSGNLINDVIDGLTFQLNAETTNQEKINIDMDLDSAVENVKKFIDDFNAVNKFIRSKTYVTDTGDRGLLQSERSVRNISFDLRETAMQSVASLAGGSISTLADIGIEFEKDGTMKLSDTNKLNDVLKTNTSQVQQLFTASDGIAQKMKDRIDIYIKGDNNVIDSIKSGIDQRIDRYDKRIESENKYLDRREKELRDQFAQLQQIITESQNQYNNFLAVQGQYNATGF